MTGFQRDQIGLVLGLFAAQASRKAYAASERGHKASQSGAGRIVNTKRPRRAERTRAGTPSRRAGARASRACTTAPGRLLIARRCLGSKGLEPTHDEIDILLAAIL